MAAGEMGTPALQESFLGRSSTLQDTPRKHWDVGRVVIILVVVIFFRLYAQSTVTKFDYEIGTLI